MEDNWAKGSDVAPLISHFEGAEKHGSSSKVTTTADLEYYFYFGVLCILLGFSIDKGIL